MYNMHPNNPSMRSIPNMDFQIANQPGVNIDRENDELQKIYRWINELSW